MIKGFQLILKDFLVFLADCAIKKHTVSILSLRWTSVFSLMIAERKYPYTLWIIRHVYKKVRSIYSMTNNLYLENCYVENRRESVIVKLKTHIYEATSLVLSPFTHVGKATQTVSEKRLQRGSPWLYQIKQGLVLSTRQYFRALKPYPVLCVLPCERHRCFFRCIIYIFLLYCSANTHANKLCVVFSASVGIWSVRDIMEVDQDSWSLYAIEKHGYR